MQHKKEYLVNFSCIEQEIYGTGSIHMFLVFPVQIKTITDHIRTRLQIEETITITNIVCPSDFSRKYNIRKYYIFDF